ncbi:MAG: response regulator transcription factor [Kiritimatiellaceae bacterium]|nr:response regulator transcription factor [Kiritimatiellaceae bacterium]
MMNHRDESTRQVMLSAENQQELPVVLIVEDDPDILLFIEMELSGDYTVVKATDGQDGLNKALEHIPDLVITDVMMPIMNGITLCTQLKQRPETSHIPVIMLTAKASVESQLEGLKTGADDYVTKPFNTLVLRARIANLLESRRMLREQFQKEHPLMSPKFFEHTSDQEFVEKAVRIVKEHLSDADFKPDDLSILLNMSLRTLHRKLRAVAGRTPADFINELRMIRAAELLLSSVDTVSEISFRIGCSEPTNFARLFKRCYDMSPSAYRTLHGGPQVDE